MAPILICAAVGFGLAKTKLAYDNKMVSMLVSNVGYPSLILSHLAAQHVALRSFLTMIVAAALSIACFGVISFFILKAAGLPRRAYLSPMMLVNVGNIGLPVCMLAYGNAGLAYAIAFVIVVLVGVFTFGMWLPMGKIVPGDILRKPVIYAVALALFLMVTDTSLPQPIDKALTILGGLTIPLMLLTLGHTLATLHTGTLSKSVLLAGAHLVMAVCVSLSLAWLFGFSGTERGVFILQCLMPVSVATYLWVEMYNPDEAPGVAGFILVSTLMAVAVLPVTLAFLI